MSTPTDLTQLEKETVRKVKWHLMPLIIIGMACCFLDRLNIGFAALQMNADLHLVPAAFGFAAGVFFLGYFIFEVPSNLMMAKFGAKKWLTRIMLSWGIIAAATAFAPSARGLYVVRFLLGLAEAGFSPGLILCITYWFRPKDQAKAISGIFLGSSVALITAGPLSGYLLGWHAFGLRGWQWLFIVEGLIPVAFAFVLWFLWPNSPEQAKWLRPEQKEWLVKTIAADNAVKDKTQRITVFEAITRPGTLVLFFVFFLQGAAYLGQTFWMAQILNSFGKHLTAMEVGMLTVLPNICLMISLIFWSRHSDATGERHWHYVISCLMSGAGLSCFFFGTMNLAVAVFAVCLTGLGAGGTMALFFTAVTQLLGKKEAAAGIAFINSGSALGGFVGSYLVGILRGIFGNYQVAMLVFASAYVLIAVIMHFFFVKTGTGKVKEVTEGLAV